MSRTLEVAMHDLNIAQNQYDRTTMEIGQLYSDLVRFKDEKINEKIVVKLELLIKFESHIKNLEAEINAMT